MEKDIFDKLKTKHGTHKGAAAALGVSYTRYNEWRWRPEIIPVPMKRYLELSLQVEELKNGH